MKWVKFVVLRPLRSSTTNMSKWPIYPAAMPQEAFLATTIDNDSWTAGTGPVRAAEHLIVWVQEGQASLMVDGQTFPIEANQLILVSKEQLFDFPSITLPLQGLLIAFGDCFWDKTPVSTRNCKATLFNNTQAKRVLPLPADNADITTILQSALTEYNTAAYTSQPDVLAAYLKILVIKIANLHALLTPQTEEADYLLYQQFMQLLTAAVGQYKDVRSFATKLGVSDRKLAAVCKQYAGKGAKEIINDQVVAEAKRLLRFTPKNIKEISYDLHFTTPYQFSNFFKKYTSYSPLQYRQQ